MQNIPIGSFSGTLLDFITVSRALGIGYVWIDAFCIIQQDDEDFARESVSMYKVYGHALLAISICSSMRAAQSFLIPRECESMKSEKFVFARSRPSLPAKTLQDVREGSPLMKRAWTFQEELLSPRVLY